MIINFQIMQESRNLHIHPFFSLITSLTTSVTTSPAGGSSGTATSPSVKPSKFPTWLKYRAGWRTLAVSASWPKSRVRVAWRSAITSGPLLIDTLHCSLEALMRLKKQGINTGLILFLLGSRVIYIFIVNFLYWIFFLYFTLFWNFFRDETFHWLSHRRRHCYDYPC